MYGSFWRNEYAHMARRHGRELQRTLALADQFEKWIVDSGLMNREAAASVVETLYQAATEEADK